MCGRFAPYPDLSFYPRFNLPLGSQLASYPSASPGQQLPLIINIAGNNKLIYKLWGHLPPWSKSSRPLINARSETVVAKPMFKKAFAAFRCLVPASGYYEWQKTSSGSTPYYFEDPDAKYIGLAGLYFDDSFVILTTAATPVLTTIHNRMPLILPPTSESLWLNPDTTPTDLHLLLSVSPPSIAYQPV